jgi:hypothetical protein
LLDNGGSQSQLVQGIESSPEFVAAQAAAACTTATATVGPGVQLAPKAASNPARAAATPPPLRAESALPKAVNHPGQVGATGVIVAHPLPTSLKLAAVAPSPGSLEGTGSHGTGGRRVNAAMAIGHITVQAGADRPIVLHAVARADQVDPPRADKQATVSVAAPRPPEQMSKPFLGSTVLGDRPVDPARSPQNAQFVAQVDRGLLPREAEALRLARWSGLLDEGGLDRTADARRWAAWNHAPANESSRTQVAPRIFSNTGYANDLVSNYHTSFPRRSADRAGLGGWFAPLLGGGRDEDVLADVAALDAYFSHVV